MAEPVVKKARTDNRPGRKERTDNPTNPYGDPWPLAVLNFKSDAQEIEEVDMKQEEKELQFKEYHEEVAARHKAMQLVRNYWKESQKEKESEKDQEMEKEKEKDQGEKDQEKDKEYTRLLRSKPPQEHQQEHQHPDRLVQQQQQERADRRDRDREDRIADRRVAGLIRDYFPEWTQIEVHSVTVQGRSLWQVLREDIAVPDHRSGWLMQTPRQGREYFQRLREIYRRQPREEPAQDQENEDQEGGH
jgi:hypothetical protein